LDPAKFHLLGFLASHSCTAVTNGNCNFYVINKMEFPVKRLCYPAPLYFG
jgi:hypothetical protein